MKLEDIGFYTLNNKRAKCTSFNSQLMRGEIIITDVCNYKCPYCRGVRDEIKGTIPLEQAKHIVDLWTKDNLKNIRFSGGEPTVYKGLVELVKYTKSKGVERIAISTNGSAKWELYKELIEAGANDFSISLDACCSAFGDMMAGGIEGSWNKVIENIKEISKLTYVTVGVVVTEETVAELKNTIEFAASLGVADIRIISSAQYNNDRNVRGLRSHDSHRCSLVLDDSAIAGNFHFPCIIYMREGGDPIGKVGDNMRQERMHWMENNDTHCNDICKKNCLDVCIDYNNKYQEFKIEDCSLDKMDSTNFTWDKWRAGSIKEFDIPCRFQSLTSAFSKNVLREHAVGWTWGESLMCRPKKNEIATMFYRNGEYFWFHLRRNEFYEIFVK
jgi:pyruvate-formate lyase-activating enzyme